MERQQLTLGRFTLQPGRLLILDGKPVALGPKALGILTILVEAHGNLVTKDELIERIWTDAIEDNTLQSHISALRKALGEDARWIATVPGQGYRYAGPRPGSSAVAETVAEGERPEPQPDDGPPPKRDKDSRRPWIIGIAAFAALPAAIVAWRWMPIRSEKSVQIERYLVLPFVNRTGDPKSEDFADALSDALAGRIAAQAWDSQIVGHGEAFHYKGQPINEAKLAKDLDLSYIIEGSLPPGEAGSEAMATIIDARSATQVAVVSARALGRDPDTKRQQLAAGLTDQVLSTIFRHEKQLIAAGKEDDSDIRNLLIRAETFWGEPALDNRSEAMAHIEKALTLDPDNVHALALAGATRIRFVNAFAFDDRAERDHLLDRAGDDLEKAARIDPTRAIVQVLLGDLRSAQGRRDAARTHYDRALELDPSSARALNRLASEDIYADRIDDALAKLDRALPDNPDDRYLIDGDLAVIRMMQGRNDEALASIRRSVALDASDPWGSIYLAGLLQITGRADEAREAVAVLRKLVPGITIAKLRLADANTGPLYLAMREKLYSALAESGLRP